MTARRLDWPADIKRRPSVMGIVLGTALCLLSAVAFPRAASADEVTDWNAVALRAVAIAKLPAPITPRALAIVHIAMFDALNGIERRFAPLHVDRPAPRGASPRAAVAYAASTAVNLVLRDLVAADQVAAFDTLVNDQLVASLAGIAADRAVARSESIERGRQWGIDVAHAVVSWRQTDGLVYPGGPVFVGATGVGEWRPTPPANASMLVPTMAEMKPFVIGSVADFRPAGPRRLDSNEYAADVNEVQAVGAVGGLASGKRTSQQELSARFWAGTAASFWNRAAVEASRQARLTLYENARLFALLNIAQADAALVTWEAKVYYNFWRPITAIRLASSDGNPDTIQDDSWTPLITTPPYPEYSSGHQSGAGSAQAILTAYFGARPVAGYSEAFGPDVILQWSSFAAAADDALMARVWSGIHFRSTMVDTRKMAERVAAYVLEHAAQPVPRSSMRQRARLR